MVHPIMLAVSALSLAATPAIAAPRDPAPAAAPAQTSNAVPAPTQRYCYMSERTGSLLRSKICKTYAEWQREGVDPVKDIAGSRR